MAAALSRACRGPSSSAASSARASKLATMQACVLRLLSPRRQEGALRVLPRRGQLGGDRRVIGGQRDGMLLSPLSQATFCRGQLRGGPEAVVVREADSRTSTPLSRRGTAVSCAPPPQGALSLPAPGRRPLLPSSSIFPAIEYRANKN